MLPFYSQFDAINLHLVVKFLWNIIFQKHQGCICKRINSYKIIWTLTLGMITALCSRSTLGAKISIKHSWFTPTHPSEFQSPSNVWFFKRFPIFRRQTTAQSETQEKLRIELTLGTFFCTNIGLDAKKYLVNLITGNEAVFFLPTGHTPPPQKCFDALFTGKSTKWREKGSPIEQNKKELCVFLRCIKLVFYIMASLPLTKYLFLKSRKKTSDLDLIWLKLDKKPVY